MFVFKLFKYIESLLNNNSAEILFPNVIKEIEKNIEKYDEKYDEIVKNIQLLLNDSNERNIHENIQNISLFLREELLKIMDKEIYILKDCLNNGKYSCEQFVDKNYSFDYRLEIFIHYTNEFLQYNGLNKNELIEELTRIRNMLFLPLSIHSTDVNSSRLTHYLYCPQKGCPFEMRLSFPNSQTIPRKISIPKDMANKEIRPLEKSGGMILITFFSCLQYHSHNTTFDHSRQLKRFLSKGELIKMEEELKTNQTTFQNNHKNLMLRNQSINYLVNKVNSNVNNEVLFLKSLDSPPKDDSIFFHIVNKTNDGMYHSFMFINKEIICHEYSKKLFCDDTSGLTKYNKNMLSIVVKNDYGFAQINRKGPPCTPRYP